MFSNGQYKKLNELCSFNKKNIKPKNGIKYFHYSLPSFDKDKTPEEDYGENIKSSKFVLKEGDILYNKLNVRFKRVWNIDFTPKVNSICSTEFIPIQPKNIDRNFLFYYLVSDKFTEIMINCSNGTSGSHQRIDLNNFKDLEIFVPPYESQVKIGNMLYILDSKINQNKLIIKNLQNIIDLIFGYWFLQFDFPNENNEPYKSSGGEMIWSDELNREIPKGWSVGNLYDIADFINGLACQKHRPITDNKLPVIKIKEMHDGFTDKTEFVKSDIDDKYIINDGDILFSWSATLETMIWAGGKGGLNQHIFKVIPKDYAKYYVYMQLSSYVINFVRIAESRKTTMGHITKDHLKQSKIPLPPKELTYKFNDLVADLYDKFLLNSKENRELASLRDFLLPLLMSGQVGFKD